MHIILILALALAGCRSGPGERAPARTLGPGTTPVRISMDMLHRAGGVPPGWRLTPPEGDVAEGRRTFAELGCHSCHTIKGEDFGQTGRDETSVGPDLTGMGSHHPAAYFAEAILNPDAVLVEGPGYITEDGRSRMPAYPDLTVVQLADLVAYLRSLTDPTGARMPPRPGSLVAPRPAPPPRDATTFYVQTYDVKDGQLAAFEEWFRTEGAPGFLAQDGFLSIETYVDNTRSGPALVTLMAFRDDAALGRFLDDPAGTSLKARWDEFIGPHGHQVFRLPPVYRVATLSAP